MGNQEQPRVGQYRVSFDFSHTDLTELRKQAFEEDVRAVFDPLAASASKSDLPSFELSILLAHDLPSAVNELESARLDLVVTDENRYTGQRLGGTVVGKLLAQKEDHSSMVLVFQHDFWADEVSTNLTARVAGIGLIAHELVHPFVERTLWVAGFRVALDSPPTSRSELVSHLAFELWGEYQADFLSDTVLQSLEFGQDGGKPSVGLWDLWGEAMEESMEDVLTQIYPSMPEQVQAYREHGSSLDQMWFSVNQTFRGALVALMHAQVAADSKGRTNLLGEDSFKTLPAVRLYFGEPWKEFLRVLDAAPVMGSLRAVTEAAEVVVSSCDRLMSHIWQQLGLEAEDGASGLFVKVEAPVWLDE